MTLPTQVLRFFSVQLGTQDRPKTLLQCLNSIPELKEIPITEVFNIIQKFKMHGYLFPANEIISGQQREKTGMSTLYESLACLNFQEDLASYGTYDFIVYGFPEIARRFEKSVFPVVITNVGGAPDLGTGFLFATSEFVATARHVIEKAENIYIKNVRGEAVKAESVLFPENPNLDIAIINVAGSEFKDIPALKAYEAGLLDEVLAIGYPPIPGFDAIRIHEVGQIGSNLKLSKGRIVATDSSYLDQVTYHLINAKVKGGNSGGPVISFQGAVIGIVTNTALDSADAEQLDRLGYGIVTPTAEIRKLILAKTGFVSKTVANSESGFRIVE